MKKANLFSDIPEVIEEELFDLIAQKDSVHIERIVSHGHTSPKDGWFEQDKDEWVVLLKGAAKIEFVSEKPIVMVPGDHINIAAHQKHKVVWTAPGVDTVWLAIHY